MKQQYQGFTLIEMMVVVVIIGILTMVAFPSYQDYVIRGKLTEATSTLSNNRVKMEQYFQDNKTYSVGGSTTVCPSTLTASTDNFDFTCSNASVNTYTLTATGKNNVAAYSYTIDQANTKTATTPWGNSVSCWVVKKGGGC